MRFKNLTIILTLTGLSIVALAGLMLLPVASVICEVDDFGWSESNGGTFANYYAKEEIANESWYLYAELNAKGVSASGAVGLLVKDRYTEDQETLFGTANLTVKRNAYAWYHNYFVYGWRCNNRHFHDALHYDAYCGGHYEPAEADSNIAGTEGFKPFYDYEDDDGNPVPRHTTIALKVKVREPTYKELKGRIERTKKIFTSEVEASYVFAKGRVMFTYENENVLEWKLSSTKTRERVVNEAETSGHSVSVVFKKKADSSATGSISFDSSAVSTAQTVTYTGIP